MEKNEALSSFLRGKRKKTQNEAAEIVGVKQSTYCRWEVNGSLPKDHAILERLATFLLTTKEELLEKADANLANLQKDFMPLIKAIAQSNCSIIFRSDIEFLLDIQSGLALPMSPELIDSLMNHRLAQPKAQINSS